MKIIKQFNWNRIDFSYVAKCEHCGHEEIHHGGYDDANYYNNVVPRQECGKCKESSNSKPTESQTNNLTPRYNPNQIL